jgi:hypothetical protein
MMHYQSTTRATGSRAIVADADNQQQPQQLLFVYKKQHKAKAKKKTNDVDDSSFEMYNAKLDQPCSALKSQAIVMILMMTIQGSPCLLLLLVLLLPLPLLLLLLMMWLLMVVWLMLSLSSCRRMTTPQRQPRLSFGGR